MSLVSLARVLEDALRSAGARVVRDIDTPEQLIPDHVALSVDDEGIASWHCTATRAPRRRGIMKLIALPIDPVLGKLGVRGVAAWEAVARPYRLRAFTAENHQRNVTDAEPWAELGDGRRALLFVHGTFGRAHEVFDLGVDTMRTLETLYEGRVFAFDHFTLTHDPVQNVEVFLERLGARSCHIDIVCHSRGGLVARQLAVAAPDRVRVERIVFVGSPNDGTTLADPERFVQFADVFTNLCIAQRLHDALTGVVHLVGALGDDVTDRLPGVVAQRPGSPVLERLRTSLPPRDRSFGIASNFTSDGTRPSLIAADLVADGAFDAPNDLAVPVESVFPFIPVTNRLSFDGNDAVHHFGYFRRAETRERILAWLA